MTATPLRDDPADTGTQFAGLTDMQRAAASADFHMATCDAPAIADCEECRRRLSRIRTYLAAVLPEHRRMVLTEAEAAIEDARSGWPDGHTVTIGYDEAIEVVRRLAAAAPPAGSSAPVPAENAPAVPEEADGQRRSGCARCDTDQMALPCYCRRECSSDTCSAMDQTPAPAPVRQARGDALTYAEQSRAAAQGRPMVDDTAARAAGLVALADVLDALRDDDAYHRWRKALTGVRPEYPSLTTRHHLADYLAERFATQTAPEGERPRCDCDPAAHLDLHRPWFATQTAPEGADERNGHG